MRKLLVVALAPALLLACGGSPPPSAQTDPGAASADPGAANAPPTDAPAPAVASAQPAAQPTAVVATTAKPAAGKPPSSSDEAPLLGKLTEADVQATLQKNFGLFDPCYPDTLKKKNVDIKAQLKPTIGPSGKVNDLKVLKTSGDKKFDACVLDAFKKIQFPASKEGSAYVSPTWIELGGQMVMTK